MKTIILALIILFPALCLMSVGYFIKNKVIPGSCGGLNNKECNCNTVNKIICSIKPNQN